MITVLGGTISVMGSKVVGYPSAGALGCVIVAFVANIGWKRLKDQQQDPELDQNVSKMYNKSMKRKSSFNFSEGRMTIESGFYFCYLCVR